MNESHSRDGSEVFEQDDGETSVWLVRDADDYRAQHDFIALQRGEQVRYYECAGWTPESLVERILQVAGFTAAAPSSLRVEQPDPATPVVKLKGFVVPEGKGDDILTMIHRALVGNLGGFHPVVMGQAGFHRAPMVFEYLWSAAGCPPVLTRHPELVEGLAAGASKPNALEGMADRNATLEAIRSLEGGDGE